MKGRLARDRSLTPTLSHKEGGPSLGRVGCRLLRHPHKGRGRVGAPSARTFIVKMRGIHAKTIREFEGTVVSAIECRAPAATRASRPRRGDERELIEAQNKIESGGEVR